MAKRERGPKIAWRGATEGDRATARAYLDARGAAYGNAGFIALIAPGESRATTDRATADRLAIQKAAELTGAKTERGGAAGDEGE